MSTTFATRTLDGVEIPAAGVYALDPAHSSVGAVARHLMVTKVRGYFRDFSGTIHIDDDPLKSWVEIEIKADSIDTRMPARDEHLRSPDFLDAQTYPTLTFRSTGFERTSSESFDLHGDLTIRGITRSITLRATYGGVAPDQKGARLFFSATGELDREAFGITWNQALETGGVLVSKTLKLDIEIAAVSA